MAQELSDKIRAAAQAKGIDPEIALRIARAESSNNPAAQAKTSSAGGLFQVVDKTWKEFGGAPGKKFDPDENIRVGTDIIASNTNSLKKFLNRDPRPAEVYAAHYFGFAGAKPFLTAEPGTPMESLLSKDAIKANPNLKGKTSDQIMATLEKKMGGTPAPTVSRETFAPVPREPLPPSLPPMAAAPEEAAPVAAAPADRMAALGPSYQAALALSFLADTDEKEDRDIDREPGVAEKYLAEMDAAPRPTALAGFSDISIKSPFAEPPKPQMLADGGEVEEEFYPDAGRPTVQETHVAKAMFPDMPVAEAVYLLRGGQRQSTSMGEMLSGNIGAQIPLGKDASAMLMLAGSRPERSNSESKALMAAFNKRVGDEGGLDINVVRPLDAPPGIFAGGASASYPLGEGRISGNVNALKLPGQDPRITGYGVGYGGRVGPGNLSAGIMKQKDGPYSGQIEYRLPIGRADGGEVQEPGLLSVPTYSKTVSHEMYPGQSGQFDQQDAARHMLAAGTLSRKYGPRAAEMLGQLHEIGTSPLKFLGSKLGISEMPIDYEQDLHNNRVGIELGKRSKSQKDLEDLVQQMAEQARGERTEGSAWKGKPVRRADGGMGEPTPEEIEAASRPATMNPNIQRQGEAARRLAAMRDVNTLPDPKTYAAVSGFLGTAPDEMGFSAMHPDREGIKTAGQAGFGVGTALQVAPLLGGAMKLANIGPSAGGKATAAQQLGAIKVPGKTPEPIFSPIPSADAPFVGRLDEMVANLPGPVQKDQFLGMLKGKMRDYDIARAESTLADLPGNAKLNPVDLLNRIKTQYDPSQFKTTVVPPGQKISNYQSSDNPYKGATGDGPPLGVIHLSQFAGPKAAQIEEITDMANNALIRLGSSSAFHSHSVMQLKTADALLRAANSPALGLSESTASGMRTLGTQYRQVALQKKAIDKVLNDIFYPASDPNYSKKVNAYANEFENQGVSYVKSYHDAAVRFAKERFEENNKILRDNNLPTVPVPDFYSLNNPVLWAIEDTPRSEELKAQVLDFLKDAKKPLNETLETMKGTADELMGKFQTEIKRVPPYKGQHSALKNSPDNPISFSRFSEHTTDIPGIGKADGIYVNELQSDLLDDLRKKGVKGGSLEKDEKKLRELEGSMRGVTDPTERQAIESKMRNLRTRLFEGMGPNNTPKEGFYELSGSFPGMESSPQVAQQLMVKNAVSGAMQMGKQFVAFPGAESAQAQLYEKLGPNLKAAVKDLGPGFELRDVTLRDPDGKQLMHKAIVWGPDAAARVQKKGVPFKDGGAVERQTADHRKYL